MESFDEWERRCIEDAVEFVTDKFYEENGRDPDLKDLNYGLEDYWESQREALYEEV